MLSLVPGKSRFDNHFGPPGNDGPVCRVCLERIRCKKVLASSQSMPQARSSWKVINLLECKIKMTLALKGRLFQH